MLSFFLYIYVIEKRKVWKVILPVLSSLCLFVSYDISTNSETCPLCYGHSSCYIVENEISVDFWSKLFTIFKSHSGKLVLFGKHDQKHVVMKQIFWSLHTLQEGLEYDVADLVDHCKKDSQFKIRCHNSSTCKSLLDKFMHHSIESSMQKFVLCPSTSSPHFFLMMFHDNKFMMCTEFLNLLTILSTNIEPILLQVLKADDGWPVPEYLGACGNLFIVSHEGSMLSSHFHIPWIARAYLAVQLLQGADDFIFKHDNFAFYLTDISPYNILVNSVGKIIFVDLDNTIIIDKTAFVNDSRVHISEIIYNEGRVEFTFTTSDICDHSISDHNHYAVCQHILVYSDELEMGLLHDAPPEIALKFPTLTDYIEECRLPKLTSSRIEAGKKLKKLLMEILLSEKFLW